MQALFEIANLTNHIPFSYDLQTKRSFDITQQLRIFEKNIVSFIGSSGFAALYPDLTDSKSQYYSMNNIDKMLYMLRNYNQTVYDNIFYFDYFYYKDQPTLQQQCQQMLSQSIAGVQQNFHQLYLIMRQKKGIDTDQDITLLMKTFLDQCANNTCTQRLEWFINTLSGNNPNFTQCDSMWRVSNFDKLNRTFSTVRNRFSASAAYLVASMSAALTVESAYRTLSTQDLSYWKNIQFKYEVKIRDVLQRFRRMDKALMDNMKNSVYTFVSRYIISPDIINLGPEKVSLNLRNLLPKYYQDATSWLIVMIPINDVYKLSSNNYYNCETCFLIQDTALPNESYYYIFVSYSLKSIDNKKYLSQFDWKTLLANKTSQEKAQLAYNGGFCVSGVYSFLKTDGQIFIYNTDENYLIIENTFIWSQKADCPSTSTMTNQDKINNNTNEKVFRLAKGFTGRSNNCFGLALRRVHKSLQYAYRDRKVKKRRTRRAWIHTINAAVREHGISYSRFQFGLTRSNIQLDRKILSDLAVNEPFSFKAVIEEVHKQVDFKEQVKVKPRYLQARGISYDQALQQGYLRTTVPTKEELIEIEKSLIPPQAQMFGLRFPERDSKTPADYMRLSYKEEDEKFLKEQERFTLTEKEQKKMPREVLQDNWDEDMSVYKDKRKP